MRLLAWTDPAESVRRVGFGFALISSMIQSLFILLALILSLSSFSAQAEALKCHSVFSFDTLATMATPVPRLDPAETFDVTAFAENTTARVLAEMAAREMLLKQDSPKLRARDLLIPNGGLCGPVCATNLVGAMMSQNRNFRSFPRLAGDLTEYILTKYRAATGRDGRQSSNIIDLANAIVGALPGLASLNRYDSTFANINVTVRHYDKELYPHTLQRALRDDTVAIATVEAVQGSTGPLQPHAITILKIDTTNRHLYISDPNMPNIISRRSYFFTEGTNIAFHVPFTFGAEPVELTRATTFTRSFHENR